MRAAGWQVDGVWWFQQNGSSMDLDDQDQEAWNTWRDPPVADLGHALPEGWINMIPNAVHPEFVLWFRERYETERAALQADEREAHERSRHRYWLSALYEHLPESAPS
jgi:hypothetical protein